MVTPMRAVAGLLALAIAAALTPGRPAVVNESPSLPRGLYVASAGEIGRGSIVMLQQPDAARRYLVQLGFPAELPLLKRVAGLPGDQVCASPDTVRVAGRVARILAADRRGTELPAWRGCRRLGRDELFLLGDSAASFDSRYFGPVRAADVRGPYREVLTW
jgi:conjugative transfer signal peptidase TraF